MKTAPASPACEDKEEGASQVRPHRVPSESGFKLSNELKQHVTRTLSENYGQPGATEITTSVDRLQQDGSEASKPEWGPGTCGKAGSLALGSASCVTRKLPLFKCCGSNSSADWQHSAYILSREAEGRLVPDSCCKTVVARCGQRAHPSNIYKVEGGCITKLEQFLANHLLLMGAVGIGVACLQVSEEGGRRRALNALPRAVIPDH
ncbi:hypothetical protein QTO34_017209 [Cnephaeus nilssonii]|uniref:Uncharacterized protein n=1 Tax=Cnephaeus nilssonii TaxID=3371016 RepID=A0AA40LPM1_CNENI|nr:hypothetical protein QTO34_017209 [Eptesicus nilssonii]